MKSFTSLLVAFSCFILILLSCKKESVKVDKETKFNIPFKSSVNEHVALSNEESQVVVQVKNISDERCANHLDCAHSGLATVRIELTNTRNATAESLLYLGIQGEENKSLDSVTIKLDNKLYLVTLRDVNPHPMMRSEAIQTAELCVKPKQ